MRTKLFILFLNHDYTEEDEKDVFKVFLFIFFILFIFFSVIMVQKTKMSNYEMTNLFFWFCSFPGSAWERVLGGSAACSVRRWQSHLGKRSQAEPGNEHRREFALNLTAMGFTPCGRGLRLWLNIAQGFTLGYINSRFQRLGNLG